MVEREDYATIDYVGAARMVDLRERREQKVIAETVSRRAAGSAPNQP